MARGMNFVIASIALLLILQIAVLWTLCASLVGHNEAGMTDFDSNHETRSEMGSTALTSDTIADLQEEVMHLTKAKNSLEEQLRKKKNPSKIHFLHIGKTGGTEITQDLVKSKQIKLIFGHGHDFILGKGRPGDKYVFFVRDPCDRWVSGFLSRLRQGCPSHCHLVGSSNFGFERGKELETYYNFPTPDSLAVVYQPKSAVGLITSSNTHVLTLISTFRTWRSTSTLATCSLWGAWNIWTRI